MYYLILALQGYCIYHMVKNRTPYYWVFLILFLPVIGCIIYLVTQVYNKRDAEKITSDITNIINPTKKIKDLENKLAFSETYQNRIDLADAFLEIKDYNNAISHYKEALKDTSQNNFYATTQLINAYFRIDDFENIIAYAETIKHQSEFKKSKSQFYYGMALKHLNKIEEAEINLKAIDIRYSFYEERLALAKFLFDIKKETEAKEILNEIYNESRHMTKTNKRLYKSTIIDVEKLIKELN
ncbi:hypothetical protein PW52_11870 [Tamlana sedimentorum]|uniref:Tetratricopeptide repeat protein 21A/21B fifth ARM repeats domain-containing protein n=1 Tax=Neotamlana sedimentorum TaxID=1435349 RepID=A0A0D7W8N5_9FLAO|nr:hypothetical protein [Tamlana sedimentorum]KJD35048.1 hypothetical protein PW52_11870 [Tamlana sedimentorum]